ncbi:hypothetical protein BH20ACT15_BH20ACT15_10210 [soil metagenome]
MSREHVHRCRAGAPGVGTLVALLLFPAAAPAQEQDAAQQLAEKYAPITLVREQQDPPCDTAEEQYEPTSVGTVLGNPLVTLTRYVDGKLKKVKAAPTATDIAGLGEDHYLDIRGSPLGDTCVYAKDFAKLVEKGKAPAVTYAHIAREPGHDGFTLQYWFFWYFNQFNDLHEGDWEGMQLSFDADTPEQALGEIRSRSSSSSTRAVNAPTGTTRRSKRTARGRSSTRRRARTRPSTTPRSTSRTGSRGPASVVTTRASRCARSSRGRSCCPSGRPSAASSSGSATAAAGGSGSRASTTGPRDRSRRRSGGSPSAGWRSSARRARGCLAALSPGRR